MGKVGIPAEQRESVFATVASVLHLGNISFVEGKEADSSKVAPGAAQEHLQAAGAAVVSSSSSSWEGEVLLRQLSCLAGMTWVAKGLRI